MEYKDREYLVPLTDGCQLITKEVEKMKYHAIATARDTGKPCRVQFRNVVSGGGYDIEYFPSGEQQRVSRGSV